MAGSTPKLGLVSHILPPSSSGQAVVLYRLLRELDPASYCLISATDYRPTIDKHESDHVTRLLPGKYICLPPERQVRILNTPPVRWLTQRARSTFARVKQLGQAFRLRDGKPQGETASLFREIPSPLQSPETRSLKMRFRTMLQWVEDWFNVRPAVRQRAQNIARILRVEKCEAVVACSGDLLNIPAAYLAARELGLPFYPYMFDDYATQWVPPYQRQYAQSMMAFLMRDAEWVIVPNEFLARSYRDQYQVESTVIANSVEVIENAPPPLLPAPGHPLRIVYTGAIYTAHYDAFHSLLAALRGWPELPVELHIYTSADSKALANRGITAPAVIHSIVSSIEAIRLQQSADLLFLPLAFHSAIPEVINTSAPGKMGELLASGRPVLAHAPPESFVSWYVRTHQCGAVVDTQDIAHLRQTLWRLTYDLPWRQALVERAWHQARCDFSVRLAQVRFTQLFEQKTTTATAA